MKLYGGIDLHSNNSVVVLQDEADRAVYQKRLANDLVTVLDSDSEREAWVSFGKCRRFLQAHPSDSSPDGGPLRG